MARLGYAIVALALGTAAIAVPARAQQGSSVSLTHTVTVTVPPRVKVQMAAVASVPSSATRTSSRELSMNGLAVNISATQAWTLSIASVVAGSQHQWSLDGNSGFVAVTTGNATVASGAIS